MIPTDYHEQPTPYTTGFPILDSFAHQVQPTYGTQGSQTYANDYTPFHDFNPSHSNTQATSAPGAQHDSYGTGGYYYNTAAPPNEHLDSLSAPDPTAARIPQQHIEEGGEWQWPASEYALRPNASTQDISYSTQTVPDAVNPNPAYCSGNQVYHPLFAEDPESSSPSTCNNPVQQTTEVDYPQTAGFYDQHSTEVDNQQAFQSPESLPLSNSTAHVTNNAPFPCTFTQDSNFGIPPQDWAGLDWWNIDFNNSNFQMPLLDHTPGGGAGDQNKLFNSINGSTPVDRGSQGQSRMARDFDGLGQPSATHFSPAATNTPEPSPADSIFSGGSNFTPATTPAASPLVILETEGNERAPVTAGKEPRGDKVTGKRKRTKPHQPTMRSGAPPSSSRASGNAASTLRTSSTSGDANLSTSSHPGFAAPSEAFTFSCTVPGVAAPASHSHGASNASASSSRSNSRAKNNGLVPSASASTTSTSNGAGAATFKRPATSISISQRSRTSAPSPAAPTPSGSANPTSAQASGSFGSFSSSSSNATNWNISTAHIISPTKGDRAKKLIASRRNKLKIKAYCPKK